MLTAEEKALEDLYFDKKFACKALFEERKYEEAWKLCLDTFEIFPEPRYEQPLVYLLVEDIVKYSIKLKQYEYGNQYAPLLLVTGQGRADDGARESLIGKLSYDQGNMVTARQFLIIAYRKDKRKMFFKGKEDKKYKEFVEEAIKGKKKTAAAPKSKKAAKDKEKVKQTATVTAEDLEKIAMGGDVDTQYKLGMAYKGDGNAEKALQFLVMAADNGNAEAMNELGGMYIQGDMVDTDYEKGLMWMDKAANADSVIACWNLGNLYGKGSAGKKDPGKSLFYFLKGTELGDARAMRQVSDMYHNGIGTEPDEKLAEEWNKRAEAKLELDKLMRKIQVLILEGNTLFDKKDMKAAREKFEAALELVPEPKGSHYDATWLNAAIGDTYIQEQDSETALEYFTEAYYGIQGQLNPYVVYMMGKCNFELGNEEDAKKYFRLAHELDKAIFDEDEGRFLEFV